MGKIKIFAETFSFKSDFSQFTLENIKPYMDVQAKLSALYEDVLKKAKELDNVVSCMNVLDEEMASAAKGAIQRLAKCDSSQQEEIEQESKEEQEEIGNRIGAQSDLFDKLNEEAKDLQSQITNLKTQMLIQLCNSSFFESFCLHTKEVDREVIAEVYGAIMKSLGHFDKFWDSCPDVETFTHGTAPWLFFWKRKEKFKVHELHSTTLIRETMAAEQARLAMTNKNRLDSGIWDNICKFIAILVRPESEKDEIAFTNKSFVNAYKLRGLDFQGKLNYYLTKLDAVWVKREEQFKDLPLPIAIGVLNEYFKKKRN